MIYIFINILLCTYLIWTSLNINTKSVGSDNSLININLISGATTVVLIITICAVLWGPTKFSIGLEHLVLFLTAIIFIEVSFYFLTTVSKKRNAILNIIEFILIAFAAYISFGKLHFTEENYKNFVITSDYIFNGDALKFFPITWKGVYYGFYLYVLPAFSLIIAIINSENSDSRLSVQRAHFSSAAMIFGWVGLYLIQVSSSIIPMTITLYLVIVGVMMTLLAKAATFEKVYDGATIFFLALNLIIELALPAVVGGFIFVTFGTMSHWSNKFYLLIVLIVLIVVIELANLLASSARRLSNYRTSQYGSALEVDLSNINYDSETADICGELLSILRNRVDVADMTVLIENGTGELDTTYTSNGTKVSIPINHEGIDVLLKNNISVVFQEDVGSVYGLVDRAAAVNTLFVQTDAQAIILLREGSHVMGMLILSDKKSGATYDDYDRVAFNKLYSYFFVFGYYMSNIANASVVGTVQREIKMSSQIIKSIQENMDLIESPKADVGYLMVPAHNIGGEFVDLIRLTKTRHIIVVGSLSGRGISASMSMVILKSIIRTFLSTTHDFKRLVVKVNDFIRSSLPKGTFFAGIFCLVDFKTDTMYYINCGIPTMLAYTKSFNNVIETQGAGYVLGFVKDVTPLLKVKEMKLNPGDIIAISTAGLINSHSLSGEQFGKDRIKQTMLDTYMYEASRMVTFAFDNLQRFMAKELSDDITLVIMRYLGKDTQTITMEDEAPAEVPPTGIPENTQDDQTVVDSKEA